MGLCATTEIESKESSLNLEKIILEATGKELTHKNTGEKKAFRASIKSDDFHDHMVEEHDKDRVRDKYDWDDKNPESLGTGTSGTVIAGMFDESMVARPLFCGA